VSRVFPGLLIGLLVGFGGSVWARSIFTPKPTRASATHPVLTDWEVETVTLSLEDYQSLFFELSAYRERP
tara:strand:+ start:311 stop:520 length:210 start_codon:yes stop_codon:yes gene_type:complete